VDAGGGGPRHPAFLRGTDGHPPRRGLLDAYRLRWDLADVASFLTTLSGPHRDDDDTRTAWAGLRAVLEEEEP
jgi:spectinomycin phosphotransferase